MARLDLVEEGDRLAVAEMEAVSGASAALAPCCGLTHACVIWARSTGAARPPQACQRRRCTGRAPALGLSAVAAPPLSSGPRTRLPAQPFATSPTLPPWALPQVGNCGVECKTVERAAELIMGEHDTDAAEVLFTVRRRCGFAAGQGSTGRSGNGSWQPLLPVSCGRRHAYVATGSGEEPGEMCRAGHACWPPACRLDFPLPAHGMHAVILQGKKNRAQFNNWLCYELTGVCKSKPPPLPKVGARREESHTWGQRLGTLHPAVAPKCIPATQRRQLPPPSLAMHAVTPMLCALCPALQGRTPGPAFQPKGEGDADLDRVMGQMQVRRTRCGGDSVAATAAAAVAASAAAAVAVAALPAASAAARTRGAPPPGVYKCTWRGVCA